MRWKRLRVAGEMFDINVVYAAGGLVDLPPGASLALTDVKRTPPAPVWTCAHCGRKTNDPKGRCVGCGAPIERGRWMARRRDDVPEGGRIDEQKERDSLRSMLHAGLIGPDEFNKAMVDSFGREIARGDATHGRV